MPPPPTELPHASNDALHTVIIYLALYLVLVIYLVLIWGCTSCCRKQGANSLGKKQGPTRLCHANPVPSACGPCILTPLFPACGLLLTPALKLHSIFPLSRWRCSSSVGRESTEVSMLTSCATQAPQSQLVRPAQARLSLRSGSPLAGCRAQDTSSTERHRQPGPAPRRAENMEHGLYESLPLLST